MKVAPALLATACGSSVWRVPGTPHRPTAFANGAFSWTSVDRRLRGRQTQLALPFPSLRGERRKGEAPQGAQSELAADTARLCANTGYHL